jgi:hypothetical protein
MRKAMCRFCERKFHNAQSVRAHLKHCIVYRLECQAATGSRDAVPRDSEDTIKVGSRVASPDTKVSGMACLPRRASRDSLLLLLDVSEALQELLRRAASRVQIARLLESVWFEQALRVEWEQIFCALKDLEQASSGMREHLYLDHPIVKHLYERMLDIRWRWLAYDRTGQGEPTGRRFVDDPDAMSGAKQRGVETSESLLDALVLNLKKLVVHSRYL